MNVGIFPGINLNSRGREEPRRRTVTLLSSNPSLAIPSWAQGGKGIVYVTGCGGGGSGAITTTNGQRGGGGGGGAFAIRCPMVIPSGQTTANAVVGAGGSARTGASGIDGLAGGDTSLTIGSISLTLGGGGGGGRPNGGRSGFANLPANSAPTGTSPPIDRHIGMQTGTVPVAAFGISMGMMGFAGDFSVPFGAGASSHFGIGGAGVSAGPSANTNGDNATGYSAGGAGALWISGGNVTSGAGSPGLLVLEFVEGV